MKRSQNGWTTDAACCGFIVFLLALTLLFSERVPGWLSLAAQFTMALAVCATAGWLLRRMGESFVAVAIRTALVVGFCSFLFGAIENLQHILIEGWKDDRLLALEHAVTGLDISASLQRFVHPALTEMMMFAYVIYVPALSGVALLCYRSGGAQAAQDYLLHLVLVNMACCVGFILFPLASPLFHHPQLYTVPLNGWIFTWCGEWIRHTQHYAGGSLPSPHCAGASVMLAMLYRYDRRSFRVALPIVLVLYVSTVYGRYHYVADAIAGGLTAVAVLKLVSMIQTGVRYENAGNWWHRIHWQRAD